MLHIWGSNFKVAGFDNLKNLFLTHSEQKNLLENIVHSYPDIKEIFLLSTCNRTELYYISPVSVPVADIFSYKDRFYTYNSEYAVFHFIKVITGLDSQIIGEPQITGQVKRAVNYAIEHRFSACIFSTLLDWALAFNKYIRNTTKISNGNLSYGAILIKLLKRNFKSINDLNILIFGTGKLAENLINYFKKYNCKITVVSHKYFEKAEKLAELVNGKAIEYRESVRFLGKSDVIITATISPHIIIKEEHLNYIKANAIIFDLTLQGNVDKIVKQKRTLYTLKEFEIEIEKIRKTKEEEKEKAEEIIRRIIYGKDLLMDKKEKMLKKLYEKIKIFLIK